MSYIVPSKNLKCLMFDMFCVLLIITLSLPSQLKYNILAST